MICEILGRIAVKINFYGVVNIVYMQQCHSQQVSPRNIYVTTFNIFLRLFCIWTSYVLLSDFLLFVLKFYTIPVRSHDVRLFLSRKTVSKQTCRIFYRENMMSFLNYVTATLRALFAWRGSYDDTGFAYLKIDDWEYRTHVQIACISL